MIYAVCHMPHVPKQFSQDLLCLQGMDPSELNLENLNYSQANTLAGHHTGKVCKAAWQETLGQSQLQPPSLWLPWQGLSLDGLGHLY